MDVPTWQGKRQTTVHNVLGKAACKTMKNWQCRDTDCISGQSTCDPKHPQHLWTTQTASHVLPEANPIERPVAQLKKQKNRGLRCHIGPSFVQSETKRQLAQTLRAKPQLGNNLTHKPSKLISKTKLDVHNLWPTFQFRAKSHTIIPNKNPQKTKAWQKTCKQINQTNMWHNIQAQMLQMHNWLYAWQPKLRGHIQAKEKRQGVAVFPWRHNQGMMMNRPQSTDTVLSKNCRAQFSHALTRNICHICATVQLPIWPARRNIMHSFNRWYLFVIPN